MTVDTLEPDPLHIAFYCNLMGWPKRSTGGVRPWALRMMNGLVARGHRVAVLTEAPPERFTDEPLLDARVERVLLGSKRDAERGLEDFALRNPGVRIVASLMYYNLRAARLKRRLGAGVYVMLVQHENLSADNPANLYTTFRALRKRWKYRRLTRGVRRTFAGTDAVVGVSRGVADDLATNFGVSRRRLHSIYNPVFEQGFVDSAREQPDHPWLLDKKFPVLISVGSLHHVKGFDHLLAAMVIVRRTVAARLLILGEGPERANLQARVVELGLSDCVEMPGRMGKVAAAMARADVYVLSSRREGLPTVLIEALSVGLPIVSTRCPSGPDEILEEGRFGFLVDVGDVEAMAACIARVLQEPALEKTVLQARARDFSLDRALDSYLELWRRPPVPVE